MIANLPEPKFKIGSDIYFEVTAEVKELKRKLTEWVKFTIVSIELGADAEKYYYQYGLAIDACAPYYAGSGIQYRATEDKLKETRPE